MAPENYSIVFLNKCFYLVHNFDKNMKILNLYAGIGGNRKLWENAEITAIELDEKITNLYKNLYPSDNVICTDAHNYLLHHYKEFDFIWSSPPCQSHSRFIRSGRNRKPTFADLRLYEEILFLTYNYPGSWIIENVIPYYTPLITPTAKLGRHLFWSNFDINTDIEIPKLHGFFKDQNKEMKKLLHNWLDIHFDEVIYYGKNHCSTQILRNAIHPILGKHILDQFLTLNIKK